MKKVILFSFLLIFLDGLIFAQTRAVVQEIVGKVEIRKPGGEWESAREGLELPVSAFISTGFHSRAVVDLGQSVLHVKQLTRMQLEELIEKEGTVETKLFLRIGTVNATIRTSEDLEVKFTLRSPVATASVRGTEFEFDGVTVQTFEGTVISVNRVGQTRSVVAGQQSSAPGFTAPTTAVEELEAEAVVVSNTAKAAPEEEEEVAVVEETAPLIPTTTAAQTSSVDIDLGFPAW